MNHHQQLRTAESNVFHPKGKLPQMPSVKSIQYLRDNVYLAGNTTSGPSPAGAMIIQGTNTPTQSGQFNQHMQTNEQRSEGHDQSNQMDSTHIVQRSDVSQTHANVGTKEGNFFDKSAKDLELQAFAMNTHATTVKDEN